MQFQLELASFTRIRNYGRNFKLSTENQNLPWHRSLVATVRNVMIRLLIQVPGPKKWLILGVNLTHLVESRDLFFLEADSWQHFSMGCTEKYAADKSYDDLFQAIRALTVQKILKSKNLKSEIFPKWKLFLVFSQKLWVELYSNKRYNHIHRAASFVQL